MRFEYNNKIYDIVIEKKVNNKRTYIRVKKDLTIYVTTNIFITDKSILKVINDNYKSIAKMIQLKEKAFSNNEGFYYLGKKYDIIYVSHTNISLGEDKVFLNKDYDIYEFYKEKANKIFKERLEYNYNKFSQKIPKPSLRIRKMTTRWGVCNVKTKKITLNLELIKRNIKYLDYVIIHELSHLIHGNHSAYFWALVEENYPEYKKIVKEMKEF